MAKQTIDAYFTLKTFVCNFSGPIGNPILHSISTGPDGTSDGTSSEGICTTIVYISI